MSGRSNPEQMTFGRYRAIAKLGEGGMGMVYLAVDQGPAGFNKLKVVKCLRPSMATENEEHLSEQARQEERMFLDEIRLTALLNHRNIVQAYEVGQEGSTYFLVMEYLDGQPFRAVRSRAKKLEGGMKLPLQLRVLADALNGLHYAHELTSHDGTPLRIVHRDVSPHNVFVTYDGSIKLVDFGIAKASISSETRTEVIKGKVAYMAPEQLKSALVDRRTDIFQVGIMLWEVATGLRYWRGLSDLQIIHRLDTGDLLPIEGEGANIDPELARICGLAMAVKQDDRYPTAEAFRRDIEAYLEQSGQRTSTEDVGDYVSRLFANKRTETRAEIDAQLKRIRQDSLHAAHDVPMISIHSSMSIDAGPGSGRTEDNSPSPGARSSAMTARGLRESSTGQTASPSIVTWTGAPPNYKAYVGMAAVLCAGIGITLLFARLGPGGPVAPATPPAPSAATSPAPSAQTADAAADLVTLRLSATPREATLFLDDAELGSNPFTGHFPKDNISHRLRAQASGRATKAVLLTFESDLVISLDLEQLPADKTQSRADKSPKGTNAAQAPEFTGDPKKTKVRLDNTDPWQR
jgi:serine/threonine-protein kinase